MDDDHSFTEVPAIRVRPSIRLQLSAEANTLRFLDSSHDGRTLRATTSCPSTRMTATHHSRPAFPDPFHHAPATRLEQDLEAHMPPDWFSKDGKGTVFLEGLPGVGYVVAAAQAGHGNTEEAKRALIRSTDSLITTAGAVGGGLVAGPAGAVLGAAAGKAVGIGFEKAAAESVDPRARLGIGEQTLVSGIIEVATNAAAGGAGGVGRVLYQEAVNATARTALGRFVSSSAAGATMFSGDVLRRAVVGERVTDR